MTATTKNAGFTLFEVIVVLVITGLISVVLIQGLGLVLGVRTSVASKIIDLDQVVLHRNLVLEPLRGVVPDYPEHPYVFSGTAEQIQALTVRTLQERSGTPTGFYFPSPTTATGAKLWLCIRRTDGIRLNS